MVGGGCAFGDITESIPESEYMPVEACLSLIPISVEVVVMSGLCDGWPIPYIHPRMRLLATSLVPPTLGAYRLSLRRRKISHTTARAVMNIRPRTTPRTAPTHRGRPPLPPLSPPGEDVAPGVEGVALAGSNGYHFSIVLVYFLLKMPSSFSSSQLSGFVLVAPPLPLSSEVSTDHPKDIERGGVALRSANLLGYHFRNHIFIPLPWIIFILKLEVVQAENPDKGPLQTRCRRGILTANYEHLVRVWFDTLVSAAAHVALSIVHLCPSERRNRKNINIIVWSDDTLSSVVSAININVK